MDMKARAREHLEKHRDIYIGIGIGAALVGITWVIVRRNESPFLRSAFDEALSLDRPSYVASHSFNTTVDASTHIHGVKRLSYIVSNPATGEWWRSQAEAARAIGTSTSRISQHLNYGAPIGGHPGLSLVREGISSVL